MIRQTSVPPIPYLLMLTASNTCSDSHRGSTTNKCTVSKKWNLSVSPSSWRRFFKHSCWSYTADLNLRFRCYWLSCEHHFTVRRSMQNVRCGTVGCGELEDEAMGRDNQATRMLDGGAACSCPKKWGKKSNKIRSNKTGFLFQPRVFFDLPQVEDTIFIQSEKERNGHSICKARNGRWRSRLRLHVYTYLLKGQENPSGHRHKALTKSFPDERKARQFPQAAVADAVRCRKWNTFSSKSAFWIASVVTCIWPSHITIVEVLTANAIRCDGMARRRAFPTQSNGTWEPPSKGDLYFGKYD